MRFRKGTKVEVLNLKEGPSGSWRCAEIIGCGSHRYTVRYEGGIELFGKLMVERVSRKAIRPSPPPVDVLEDWIPGDVVEVLHNYSWKMATILKVSGRSHLLVRLLGSTVEFKANKYDVRARICWQNGEWIVIGKASNKCEDLRFRFPSSRNNINQPRKVVTFVSGRTKGDNKLTMETQVMPLKMLKRQLSHVHTRVEPYARPNKKVRIGNKEGFWNQLDTMQQSQLPEKVENVVFSRQTMHENCMHPSFTNKIYGRSEMIVEREKTDGDVGYSHSMSLESNDDGSVSSSVGSCSVYMNPSHESHRFFAAGQYEDYDSHSSDAESFCQLRSKEGNSNLPTKEVLTDEIRRVTVKGLCTLALMKDDTVSSGSIVFSAATLTRCDCAHVYWIVLEAYDERLNHLLHKAGYCIRLECVFAQECKARILCLPQEYVKVLGLSWFIVDRVLVNFDEDSFD
ncbi:hypothetical protein KSS87_001695 [Heliosperma pusillum]|nr:hypothetical protein KSS87_001695 [Heliosperma pusillum]